MAGDGVTQHGRILAICGPVTRGPDERRTRRLPDNPRTIMTIPDDASPGPASRYARLVEQGALQADPLQAQAVARLQELHDALRARSRTAERRGPLARLGLGSLWRSAGNGDADQGSPRGIYLHGPVGRGKSMLLDLFFDTAPLERKRRVHFHAFMQEVHKRLNDLRRRAGGKGRDDTISIVAGDLIDEAQLLCFDEFHVQNIADAMILGRLFGFLFDHGLVMVATSNFSPDRLYQDGLNRDRFQPFIERLETELDRVTLAGPTDYRRQRLRDMPVYYCPNGPAAEAALAAVFATLTDGAEGARDEIAIGSRRLVAPRAARGVVWFDFAALCEQPLGAADYLALAERYHTVIVRGVPRLTAARHNEARRFMTLVDALYECHVNLVISADAEPDQLYQAGDGAFEFERTASRLMEMRGGSYIETPPSTVAAADFMPFALTTDLT